RSAALGLRGIAERSRTIWGANGGGTIASTAPFAIKGSAADLPRRSSEIGLTALVHEGPAGEVHDRPGHGPRPVRCRTSRSRGYLVEPGETLQQSACGRALQHLPGVNASTRGNTAKHLPGMGSAFERFRRRVGAKADHPDPRRSEFA